MSEPAAWTRYSREEAHVAGAQERGGRGRGRQGLPPPPSVLLRAQLPGGARGLCRSPETSLCSALLPPSKPSPEEPSGQRYSGEQCGSHRIRQCSSQSRPVTLTLKSKLLGTAH